MAVGSAMRTWGSVSFSKDAAMLSRSWLLLFLFSL